jgi:hypothetical protein
MSDASSTNSEYPSRSEQAKRSRSESERLRAISRAGRGVTGSKIAPSAVLMRLADRLGRNPEELAASIDEDTLRRTKFPVDEIDHEDGTITFKHPLGIIEGRRATFQ